jgi:hypothetical protein
VGSDDRVADRLNQLLREHGFDDFVEGQCASFYAETINVTVTARSTSCASRAISHRV